MKTRTRALRCGIGVVILLAGPGCFLFPGYRPTNDGRAVPPVRPVREGERTRRPALPVDGSYHFSGIVKTLTMTTPVPVPGLEIELFHPETGTLATATTSGAGVYEVVASFPEELEDYLYLRVIGHEIQIGEVRGEHKKIDILLGCGPDGPYFVKFTAERGSITQMQYLFQDEPPAPVGLMPVRVATCFPGAQEQ